MQRKAKIQGDAALSWKKLQKELQPIAQSQRIASRQAMQNHHCLRPLCPRRGRGVYMLATSCCLHSLRPVCLMGPSCPSSSGCGNWTLLSLAREARASWVSLTVFHRSLELVQGARASIRALVWQRPCWSLTLTLGRLSWLEALAAKARSLCWARR